MSVTVISFGAASKLEEQIEVLFFVNISRTLPRIEAENNLLARQSFDKTLVATRVRDLCKKTDKVYVLKQTGNEALDKFRGHIADLLGSKKSVKKSDVLQYCQKTVGEDIPMPIYTKIMKELGSSRGAIWVRLLLE